MITIATKKAIFRNALLSITVVAVTAGCQESVSSVTKETPGKTVVKTHRVRTARPQITTLSRVLTYTGTIEPIREVRVAPEIMGKIKKISVKEGDSVKKGQGLITFDTRLLRLQQKQAQAAVKVAQVQVETLEKEINRLKPLLENGAISQGEFDKVKAQYDSAIAGLDQARAAVDLSGYQLKVAKITAPFDGVVARKTVNEGEVVTPAAMGSSGMITLMDLETGVVRVGVGEKDIPAISRGMDATIEVDAYPGDRFQGVVESIALASDSMSKTFPVEIRIPNPDMKLRAGMFARVSLCVEIKEGVLAVSENAVLEEKGTTVIFTVEKGDIVRKRNVKIGMRSGNLVEILPENGLDTSQEIVVEGNFGLRDGAPIIRIYP